MLDLTNELYAILTRTEDLKGSKGMFKIKDMHIYPADLKVKHCEEVRGSWTR